MNIDLITADVVGDALHALRYAHSLAASPLLDLDAITLRLRADGLADTRQGRAWLLEHLLHELVDAALRAGRGPAAPGGPALAATDDAWLVANCHRGDAELEAWSTLYARYLSTSGRPFGEVADLVAVPGRTVRRRRLPPHPRRVRRRAPRRAGAIGRVARRRA